MANQRSKDKKLISVSIPKAVLRKIEAEARRQGTDRVKLINEVLKAHYKLPAWLLATVMACYAARNPKRATPTSVSKNAVAWIQKLQKSA